MLNKNFFGMLTIIVGVMLVFVFTACDDGSDSTVPGNNPNGNQGTAPTITTALLPNGVAMTAYSQTLAASGDTPITWNIDSGTLPTGLSLSATGVIAGTPMTTGTSNFTVKATNAAGSSTKALSITIAPGNTLTHYTVTFHANSGNGAVDPITDIYPGDSIILPYGEDYLDREGYTFIGWNTNISGTGTTYQSGGYYTPSGSVTLYAKWDNAVVTTYTVTFNANGLSGTAPNSRTVDLGFSIALPGSGELSLTYITFNGWNTRANGSGTHYAANSTYTPTGNIAIITLYAQWEIVPLFSVTGLANKLEWLQVHAQSNGSYVLEVNADESITPISNWSYGIGYLEYREKNNIAITLSGVGTNRTVSLPSSGGVSSHRGMFCVGSGVTLILDNYITLQGRSSNTDSLVRINSGGTLVMNTGSVVTGNTIASYGGGVYVDSGGTFTMNGGTISGNTVTSSTSYGGGVYVNSNATFTMSGGEISGNSVSSVSNNASASGGGVFLNYATFTLSGTARITGNTVTSSLPPSGGGVYVGRGTFTMSGGEISGNICTPSPSSPFPSTGGGVYVFSGTFTMSGGTISDNTVSGAGGGVWAHGIFNKTGGTITGYASDQTNGNAVKDSSSNIVNDKGHAVYAMDDEDSAKRKETTAGPDVILYYRNGMFSGAWDY